MSKYSNPLGNKDVYISQTYHSNSSNTAIDIGSVSVDQSVYAIADGKITTATSSGNGYCVLDVSNSSHRVFYVHTHNWKPVGTAVKKGDKICEIAPSSKNGGFPIHLHLGLNGSLKIMDYMDRSIDFRTKYHDIWESWFEHNGNSSTDPLNWSKHKDLSYSTGESIGIGKNIKFINDMNIRKSVNGTKTGTAKKGSVASVVAGGASAGDYIWWNVKFGDVLGWVADTSFNEVTKDPVTNVDGSEVVDEIELLEKEIERLELIVENQKTQIIALSTQVSELEKYEEYFKQLSISLETKI